jgi:hypothetical protein
MAGMSESKDFDPDEDFYEDDEPIENVLDAFRHGIKGITAKPAKFDVTAAPADLLLPTSSTAWPASIAVRPAESTPITARPVQVA